MRELDKKTVLQLVYGSDVWYCKDARNTPFLPEDQIRDPSGRFTQDTPVLPEVWLAFADHPGERIDLLLDPYQSPNQQGTTPARLAASLRDGLNEDRHLGRKATDMPGVDRWRAASAAFNQSTVVALLTLEEVARVVLPLSAWWRQRICPPTQTSKRGNAEKRGQKKAESTSRQCSLLRMLAAKDGREALVRALQVDAERSRLRAEGLTPSSVRTARSVKSSPPVMPQAPDVPMDILWLVRLLGTLLVAQRSTEPKSLEVAPAGTAAEWPPIGPWPSDESRRELHQSYVYAYHLEVVGATAELYKGLKAEPKAGTMVHLVSLNRTAAAKVFCSRKTVKADAAKNVFDVSCAHLAWAIIDSGIDATHPAFRLHDKDGNPEKEPFAFEEDKKNPKKPKTLKKNNTRVLARFDFRFLRQLLSSNPTDREILPKSLRDEARDGDLAQFVEQGLKKGRVFDWGSLYDCLRVPYDEDYDNDQHPLYEHGTHVAGILAADWPKGSPLGSDVTGICPDLRLYDLRVLDERGQGDEFSIMAALQFVRHLNAHKGLMVIHGVNLSLSIQHDVESYACGCTPVCRECERLVGDGIVVVAAAGNDGHRTNPDGSHGGYHFASISDPGNAEAVITVGATHRNEPHSYGVSYFSSRGPTGDGRIKPDLVAPGEKIEAPVPNRRTSRSMDGTSMAAPHVSGAAALLMGRHAELIGKPGRIKKILCETATDLGRERYFQGAGMVDILRALQSV